MLFHQKKCIYFLEITGRIGLCSLLLPLIIANTAYGCSVYMLRTIPLEFQMRYGKLRKQP